MRIISWLWGNNLRRAFGSEKSGAFFVLGFFDRVDNYFIRTGLKESALDSIVILVGKVKV